MGAPTSSVYCYYYYCCHYTLLLLLLLLFRLSLYYIIIVIIIMLLLLLLLLLFRLSLCNYFISIITSISTVRPRVRRLFDCSAAGLGRAGPNKQGIITTILIPLLLLIIILIIIILIYIYIYIYVYTHFRHPTILESMNYSCV